VVRLSTVDQQMTVHLSMAMAVIEKEEMRTKTACIHQMLSRNLCNLSEYLGKMIENFSEQQLPRNQISTCKLYLHSTGMLPDIVSKYL
jgi:hypothetical protein